MCLFLGFCPMPAGSDPVLLCVSTTEALPAWSLVDLRLVCAWSAPHVRLICAWSAQRAPRGVLFLYESFSGSISNLFRTTMDLCFLAFSYGSRKQSCATICFDH